MTPTVGDVMRETRNYFQHEAKEGAFTLARQRLLGFDDLKSGTWIAICGSRYNDGVYCLGESQHVEDARDETFSGVIWLLAPPAAFLALCGQIAAWCAEQPHDGVRREQFGGYSYELAGANGMPITWQQRFSRDLTPYRRMYSGVKTAC